MIIVAIGCLGWGYLAGWILFHILHIPWSL